jgi:hypothetical protein
MEFTFRFRRLLRLMTLARARGDHAAYLILDGQMDNLLIEKAARAMVNED